MTEAIVPYCDGLLAVNPCPRGKAGRHDFRNDQVVKALPFLDHPFGDSAQIHDYYLMCETLDGHPDDVNLCDVRTFGPGTTWPPACDDRENDQGWKDFGRTEEGENLSHPVGPGCPQHRFKLVIKRRTPKGGMATFIGNFKDLNALQGTSR